MRRRSTHDRSPSLGPALPAYPALRQVVRVTGPAGPVYRGFVRQAGGASLRDREPCYLWEPNGVAVAPGDYRTRLVGSYDGVDGPLPLYFLGLACCVPGPGFPSSSSVSASSASVSSGSSSLSSQASSLSSQASSLSSQASSLSSQPSSASSATSSPSSAQSSASSAPSSAASSAESSASSAASSAGSSAASSGASSEVSSAASSPAPSSAASSPAPSSAASAPASSPSSRTVTTTCCPGVALPTVVHATITAQTGNCNLQDFDLTITAGDIWEGFDNNGRKWDLACQAAGLACGNFLLQGTSYGANANPQPGCSCQPLFLTFNVILTAFPFCAGTATIVITV